MSTTALLSSFYILNTGHVSIHSIIPQSQEGSAMIIPILKMRKKEAGRG